MISNRSSDSDWMSSIKLGPVGRTQWAAVFNISWWTFFRMHHCSISLKRIGTPRSRCVNWQVMGAMLCLPWFLHSRFVQHGKFADRLIFNMGIPILVKDGLYIETGRWSVISLIMSKDDPLGIIFRFRLLIRLLHYRLGIFPILPNVPFQSFESHQHLPGAKSHMVFIRSTCVLMAVAQADDDTIKDCINTSIVLCGICISYTTGRKHRC